MPVLSFSLLVDVGAKRYTSVNAIMISMNAAEHIPDCYRSWRYPFNMRSIFLDYITLFLASCYHYSKHYLLQKFENIKAYVLQECHVPKSDYHPRSHRSL